MNIARDYRYGDNIGHRPRMKWWLWGPSGAVAYLRPTTWPANRLPSGYAL